MDALAEQTYTEVMQTRPPTLVGAAEAERLEYLFSEVWPRPGLSRRARRLVTLACICGNAAPSDIAPYMYGALASGDLNVAELAEFVLHFSVYCGWPRGSQAEGALRSQAARLAIERGGELAPWPVLPSDSLGPSDPEERLAQGEECFLAVNLRPAPPRDSPYFHAGILGFVFGHVWQRPGLGRVDRRYITIACVGVSTALVPIQSHVGSALGSGDVSHEEMDEIILQFSGYAKPEATELLRTTAAEYWDRTDAEPGATR